MMCYVIVWYNNYIYAVQECLSPLREVRECEGEREGGGKREVVRYVEMVREGGGEGSRRRRGERRDTEVERLREQLSIAQRQHEELSQKYITACERVSEKHLPYIFLTTIRRAWTQSEVTNLI